MQEPLLIPPPYDVVAQAVEENGCYAIYRSDCGFPDNLVCHSSRAPGGGFGGRSLWIIRVDGTWYINSWGGEHWELPPTSDVINACVEYLTLPRPGHSVAVTEAIVHSYRLIAVSESLFYQRLVDTYIPGVLRMVHERACHLREQTGRWCSTLDEVLDKTSEFYGLPWRDKNAIGNLRNLRHGYFIEVRASANDWSAEAVSPLDDRVFRIDSKGTVAKGLNG